MNHDPSTDPADARLAALYQAHLAQDGQPSAAADARILAIAREAQARPAIRPVGPGWRSWLHSSWFGPGLAFATIASVSVVVVSLMPKEDLSVERAVTQAAPVAPGAPPAAQQVAPPPASTAIAPATSQIVTPSAPPQVAPPSAPGGVPPAASPSAPGAAAPVVAATESAATPPAAPRGSAERAPREPSKAAGAQSPEPARAAPGRSAPTVTTAARRPEQPNPFPAQAPAAGGGLSDKAASVPAAPPPAVAAVPAVAVPAAAVPSAAVPSAAVPSAAVPSAAVPSAAVPSAAALASRAPPAAPTADAGLAPRPEKSSLLSEPTESRLMANQAVPEVRDSAPTYPNEVQSSIPLPYTYTTPHPPPRIAVPGPASTTGSMVGRAVPQQQYSAATRKEAAAGQSAPQAAAVPSSTITTAAAPRVRDPAEWIKAIQKLRVEGKSEQVLKELAEFRRQYPAYALPDELKQLRQ